MTNKIPLPGLIGSNPLGALTAFGLLKVLSEEFPATKLAFEMQDDWVAILHDSPFKTDTALIAWLSDWVKRPELNTLINWGDDVRMPVAEFRTKLANSLETNNKTLNEVFSALVSDGAVDKSKGLVKPSLFYMVSGQQSFLGGMREILSDIRAKPLIHPIPQPNGHCRPILHRIKAKPAHVFAADNAHQLLGGG